MAKRQIPNGSDDFVVVSDIYATVKYSIQTEDIIIDEYSLAVCGGFGKHEVEVTAGRLIHFFRHKGGWCLFTISELADYYKMMCWSPERMFFGLMGAWYDDGGFGSWRYS